MCRFPLELVLLSLLTMYLDKSTSSGYLGILFATLWSLEIPAQSRSDDGVKGTRRSGNGGDERR